MGTWGTGSFENDQALDWLAELTESKDLSLLEQSLDIEDEEDDDDEEEDEYLDADLGTDVVAASEVIAALLGRPATKLPPNLTSWLEAAPKGDVSPLRDRALAVLAKVDAENSELRDLWAENEEEFPRWQQLIADLKKRLKG